MARERYLTTFQAAKLCHASPGSVVRWIRDGKLRASITPGGHHRIELNVLLQFLKSLGMQLPRDSEEDHQTLVVSSDPQCLKKIHKMVKQRFPNAVVRDGHES
jgi:excisionase family DNA binding protein